MLSQKYGPSYSIAVCERRSTIPPSPSDDTVWNDIARFYLLGIGFRGQNALRKFGVYDDFVKASVAVNGRFDWQPGMTKREDGKITPAGKKIVSRVLPRDKLVGLLHQHITENYADANIDLLYGYDLEPESFGDEDDDTVTVRISKCDEAQEEEDDGTNNNTTTNNEYIASQESDPLCDVDALQTSTTKLLIAADGSARTVANAIERHDATQRAKINPLLRPFAPKPFKVTRFVDDNARVYKSVPIALPADWPHDLNYSSRQDRLNLEALPSDDRGNLCALLLMKPEEEFAQADASAEALRAYFDENLPQFSALIGEKEMTALAKKPASTLPAFRFAGPRLNCEKRTLVLGDAAHTVKPYYGLGANTALEDVQMLSDALDDAAKTTASSADVDDEAVVPTAVQLFSDRRSADSAALVTMSRNMDRPGKLFFLCFLAPLILDGIFHKLAPKIFDPNMFAMFQRQDITFWKIQRKKRLDRVLQILSIGTLLTGAGVGLKTGVNLLARVVGRSNMFVSIVMAAVAAIGVILRQKLATSAS